MYREIANEGQGIWFGAFLADGSQVGNLGVLLCVDEEQRNLIARFQMVATHPNHQRKGICSQLIDASIQYIFDYADERKFSSVTAVIVADPDYHAKKIYAKLGFSEREHQIIITKQASAGE